GQPGAGLLGPVLAPVRLAGAQPGDSVLYLRAAVRAPLGTGQPAFQAPQPLPLRSGQPENREQVTRRQGGRHGHAAVEADYLPVTRRGDRLGDDSEGDMPAPGPVHGHPVGLGTWRYGAGPAEPHPSNLRHPDFAGFPAQAPHVPLPPAPHDAEPLVASGLAPRWAPGRVLRVVEPGHGLREVSQRLLLHRLRAGSQPRMLGPRLGELAALLQVTRGACPARAPVLVLLDREVPHVPGVRAVVPQHRFLGGRGEHSIPRHANTLATTTDISGEVKRR